ncbi:hypothetical protein EDD15DRAFT_2199613 [Pisolithus albus]|nr:hypothetical protein EDD15DRAFT_2199613 [Pisolithus albus]
MTANHHTQPQNLEVDSTYLEKHASNRANIIPPLAHKPALPATRFKEANASSPSQQDTRKSIGGTRYQVGIPQKSSMDAACARYKAAQNLLGVEIEEEKRQQEEAACWEIEEHQAEEEAASGQVGIVDWQLGQLQIVDQWAGQLGIVDWCMRQLGIDCGIVDEEAGPQSLAALPASPKSIAALPAHPQSPAAPPITLDSTTDAPLVNQDDLEASPAAKPVSL